MTDEADMFDNNAQRKKKFLIGKDSEDEIDFDEFDIIDLINITSFTQDWDRSGGNTGCLQSKFERNIVDKLSVFNAKNETKNDLNYLFNNVASLNIVLNFIQLLRIFFNGNFSGLRDLPDILPVLPEQVLLWIWICLSEILVN